MTDKQHDCPKCGRKASCFSDRFCGKCEVELATDRQEQIDYFREQVRSCQCEEGCRTCNHALASIAELEGRHGDVARILNP